MSRFNGPPPGYRPHMPTNRRLVSQAHGKLTAQGHTESQIREWAEEYVSESDTSADLPGFLAWTASRRS